MCACGCYGYEKNKREGIKRRKLLEEEDLIRIRKNTNQFKCKYYERNMKLNNKVDLIVLLFYIFVLIIGCTSIPMSKDKLISLTEKPKELKRFIRFDDAIKMTSIINVPLHCPPEKVRVGNRCRSVF